ncbi:MAG TPA: sugar ABC transporter ATP-binding protein [Bacteroidota bacterium]
MAEMKNACSTVPPAGAVRLSMRGIRKAFGATVALDGVDLSVGAGEIHALIGENGAGKSTLMKVLSGAVTPDAGSLALDGRPFHPRTALEARRAGIAMIYQDLSLAPHLTVQENVTLGMEPARCGFIRNAEALSRTRDALARLGHEELSPAARTGSLSLGEQQVVEIARALATGCRVLVLDEPTSSLTHQDSAALFALLRRLRGQGHAIVYISHVLEEITGIADTFTVLRDGRSVGNGEIRRVTPEDLVGMMIGRNLNQLYPRSSRTTGAPLLELDGLSGLRKPRRATLTVHRGEIVGIAGLVGAGRTELLRAVFGLDPVRDGTIRLGAYHGPASPVRRWAQGAGYLSEDRGREGLASSLSITRNVLMNLRKDVGPLGFCRPSRHRSLAAGWITKLAIRAASPDQLVRTLSGGNQQKVALARLLYEDVDLLLLDEPTRGIDVASKAQLYELLDTLAAGTTGRRPRGILLVSSYLPELLGVCDRIAVMRRGTLGPALPRERWSEHTLMLEAFGQGAPA